MARMNALADVVKGLKANIYAIDNLSPVARVSFFVKAGSRYEPDAVPGISHYMRAAAGLTTQDSSYFGIGRHVERAGGSFKVTTERDYIIYRVDCLRDKLGYLLKFVDDTLHRPEFRSWELVDIVQPKLKKDLMLFRENQHAIMNETLHKTAFRGGLAHSTIIPEHMISKIKNDDCFEYWEKNFVLDRMSIVGMGVDERELGSIIEDQFFLRSEPYQGVSGATRYSGGEARVQAGFPKTLVNFVVPGSPITDTKRVAALEVIGSILGGCDQTYVKYGAGSGKSIASLLNHISPGFSSTIVNINHTDTGLFGFSMSGPNEFLKQATKQTVRHVRKVLGELNEEDVKRGKNATKARVLLAAENKEVAYETIARRHAAGVKELNPLDQVEKLTLKDIQSVAGSLLKGKPTLVSLGNPRFVPYVDELD